jgi:hypothetical protein
LNFDFFFWQPISRPIQKSDFDLRCNYRCNDFSNWASTTIWCGNKILLEPNICFEK